VSKATSAVLASLAALLVAACDGQPAQAVPAPGALNEWTGRWTGVEGTYLQLNAGPDAKYTVVIRNLDGERSFEGVGRADHIAFERDGRQEKIRATDGAGTGMKWLAGKSRCLTVRPGEGFCRE